ncbi:hypothetical protein N7490_012294 [Penicillium lividum]|nr:hypothetical protein N7490_012294 [Penicillium lividum]
MALENSRPLIHFDIGFAGSLDWAAAGTAEGLSSHIYGHSAGIGQPFSSQRVGTPRQLGEHEYGVRQRS